MAELDGKTIAITRAPGDAAEFEKLARQNGATPMALPTIELRSKGDGIVAEFLDSAAEHDPDYTIFMSSKAVRLLFGAAGTAGRQDELRLAVANTTVVSVGPKTTAALGEFGVRANCQPRDTFSSVGVGEEFTRIGAAGKTALIPRSGASTPFLKELLGKIGVRAIELHLYDVCAFRGEAGWNGFRELYSGGGIDGIVFTSASSVRAFFEIMRRDLPEAQLVDGLAGVRLVSIGPFTSDELAKFGVSSTMAKTHTVAGAFEELKSALST